jgi:Mg2+ and Co2+ transporter CorA
LRSASTSNSQQGSLQLLSVPSTSGTELCTRASGFFSAGHGDLADKSEGCYTTAFRFLVKHKDNTPQRASSAPTYRWEKLGFVTFHPSPKFFTILCLDAGDDARAQLRRRILGSKLAVLEAHPLSVHLLVLRYILESFDRAVWSWRDEVRELEMSRLHRGSATARDFDHMHEVARHLIHNTEMLTTALSVVEDMTKECDLPCSGSSDQASSACLRELQFVSSLMKALLHRSSALEKRMENEIALVSISAHTFCSDR